MTKIKRKTPNAFLDKNKGIFAESGYGASIENH
jgi:hypothetical protein